MSGDIREWREPAPTSKLQVTDLGLVVREGELNQRITHLGGGTRNPYSAFPGGPIRRVEPPRAGVNPGGRVQDVFDQL